MKEEVPVELEVRVLKSLNCPSLSGKSKLTYQFGVLNGKELEFRISSNSGGGMFAKDWVAVADVIRVLKCPAVKASISATAFTALFAGKSINTQSFLMAILKHEGVIQPHAEKKRAYEVADVAGFQARIDGLMQPGAAAVGQGKAKPTRPAKGAVSKPPTKKA